MLPCDEDDAVSLGEGLSPLLPASAIGEKLGVPNLLIKDEGRNPTWSHKDRFSTVAVSAARLQGAQVVATASSGNAGASLAAYASAAGLRCVVATFSGTTGPMLAKIRKYGATVVVLSAKTDRWTFLAEGVTRFGWFAASPFHAPVVGSHPVGIEGYKTIAYEIVEQINGVPDWCAIPVCYGDALVGIWIAMVVIVAGERIDPSAVVADQVDFVGQPAPSGVFDVIGVVSQFRPSPPYIGGYQLMPRFGDDILDTGDAPLITSAPLYYPDLAKEIAIPYEGIVVSCVVYSMDTISVPIHPQCY
jgi:threonine synthase